MLRLDFPSPMLGGKNMCALAPNFPSEAAQQPQGLRLYSPQISTEGLIPGIDNLRFDVSLSPKFVACYQRFILQLIVRYSEAGELLHKSPGPPKPSDKKEFKEILQDLLLTVLNRANTEKKPQLEVLAHATVFKFLVLEALNQFSCVIQDGREKLKVLQRPGQEHNRRGHEIQEFIASFQANKKSIFRHVARDISDLVGDARGELLRKTREAFFGPESSDHLVVFSSPLLFTEEAKNEYLNLESYVMLGHFQRDPDYFEVVDSEVRAYIDWADSTSEECRQYHSLQEACAETTSQIEELRKRQQEPAPKRGFFSRGARAQESLSPEETANKIHELEARLGEQMESFRTAAEPYSARLDAIIAAQENAAFLVDYLETQQRIAEARRAGSGDHEVAALEATSEKQVQALERLHRQFSDAGLVSFILAAYETAKIYTQFCPPLNPQQLKEALVDPVARKKVVQILAESRVQESAVQVLERSAVWVREAGPRETRATLIRFLRDYMRLQHDMRNFRVVHKLMDQIHFPLDPKQRELSEINHTLYDFLLAEEERAPKQGRVTSHVILKADIRDSTSITAELFARELNPASYFSLNFFDPIHKLMPRYGASKVFLEGDAIIMAILEREGTAQDRHSVARTCCLARDMIEGVRAVNDRAAKKNLPVVELGIGICYQATAPMYLMDGERPIMISKALNESDRLSGCGKLAKQVLTQRNRFFNVFVMQLLPNENSGGAAEEFLLHYNIEGIEINALAFEKLCQEISMNKIEIKFPLYGEPETVDLYCGTLPLGDSFQKLVVRVSRAPLLHPKDFKVVEYTDRRYYEVCSSKPLYDYVGRQLGW